MDREATSEDSPFVDRDLSAYESYQSEIPSWPQQEQSQSRNRNWLTPLKSVWPLRPEHRRRFFLFNNQNDAHHVDAYEPPWDPLHLLSNIQQQVNSALTRPVIRLATSTKLLTVTSTVITPTVAVCIPSTLFAEPNNPPDCRRKRDTLSEGIDVESPDLLNISPSLPARQ